MGDIVVTILIFVGVLGVTTVLFGGWLIMSLLRGARRWIDGTGRTNENLPSGKSCGNPGCRMVNPVHARFCRRCGADLGHVAGSTIRADYRRWQNDNRRSKIAS